MGNQTNTTSNRDYSNQASFGKAFNRAHKQTGPGSTFNYQGKSFTTNCADGGNYRKQPIEHTYTKDSILSTRGQFQTNGNKYDARSGVHILQSQKYGEIPTGTYKLSGISNTGGIQRFNLEPEKDIGIRTNLQIHQKSQTTKWDTKGCIAVEKSAIGNLKVGDTLNVKK